VNIVNRNSASSAFIASSALIVAVAAPAAASPDRNEEGPHAGYRSPYAQPLDALDGRSLAQYLADHFAHDPRLR
jgi:hypothetical protein